MESLKYSIVTYILKNASNTVKELSGTLYFPRQNTLHAITKPCII